MHSDYANEHITIITIVTSDQSNNDEVIFRFHMISYLKEITHKIMLC